MTRATIMVDWSAASDTIDKPRPDRIWLSEDGGEALYLKNRITAEDWLTARIERALSEGQELLIGFDFPFGYPAGFAEALTGSADPFAVWDWLEARITDSASTNNRFEVANEINGLLGGQGPLWGHPPSHSYAHLAPNKAGYASAFPERRRVEEIAKGASAVWKLFTTGSVGSQTLMGLPVLARLRRRFAGQIAVWPFETQDTPITLAEIWPSLLDPAVKRTLATQGGIKDAVQVQLMASAFAGLDDAALAEILDVTAPEEGWILGLGFEEALNDALRPAPPRLSDDCFALPPGVDWLPVDQALAHLKANLHPITEAAEVSTHEAGGRILATDLIAPRANPPVANSAVDGYGFAGPAGDGPQRMPLVAGRAAAGQPFRGSVPPGHAIRILTGAALPDGVDTVLLQEDSAVAAGEVAFNGPLKRGANARPAGEDVTAGAPLFDAGHKLTAPDLALLSATGQASVPVRAWLRVAILSTGDELCNPATDAPATSTFDANRPMLAEVVRGWGMTPIDLGIIPDDRATLRSAFDQAADQADVLITSGGASAGDEDHVSALLRETSAMHLWRLALKPGRPMALGQWQGAPVFGLPGNPVAALVCTLIFARPALHALAGRPWQEPTRLTLPAAFTKRKKPGRSEYLRARLGPDGVETFASEGSGRISGLSWADGLVELPHEAITITPGTPVTYLPFASLFA
ncbi:molybdopterin-binding protein [Pseudaestuariivita sp.]|uniref:molybdopterin-binding protein n=1 Tax=Pseudaestuariivita sp. TaxID=2211669 RepID=UPI004058A31D